jgi:glycosyltransferase involved in cell wall biosynthesis
MNNFATYPLISIVLPTYNGMRYLRESIESCLCQTYRNFELIIVDDCSTDDTASIINSFHDTRIRTLRHDVNKKLPAALNTGFSSSKGEFLTWTSDDNRYLPKALEVMLGYLLNFPEVGLVYSGWYMIDEQGNRRRAVPAEPPEWISKKSVVGASFLYRREVYDAIGNYDENLFRIEDYDYWLRIAKKYAIRPVDEILYEYRVHSQSLTSTESYVDRAVAYDNLLTRMYGPDRNRRNNILGEYYISNVFECYLIGKHVTILKNAYKAIRYNPKYIFNRGFVKIILWSMIQHLRA